jgi:DNA-binding NarL/FixJ family response regulator
MSTQMSTQRLIEFAHRATFVEPDHETLPSACVLMTTLTLDDLPPRQREIMLLMAKGLTNNAIAKRMRVSPSTVRNQLTNISNALGLRGGNRARSRRAYLLATFFELVPKRRKARRVKRS